MGYPLSDWRLAEAAARNNAGWCQRMCSAHGASGVFAPWGWFTGGPAPRFYPNMVTLTPHDQAAQRDAVRGLLHSGLPGGWGVKDSYAALDLSDLGFTPLLEAQWVRRPAGRPLPAPAARVARWARVASPRGLAQWERTWGSTEDEPRLFLPALLSDPQVLFLAAWEDDAVAAGAAACISGGVVGLSNLFAPAGEEEAYWAGCLALLAQTFPGLDLVDYEHGPSLEIVQALGFERSGPLVIWLAGG